MIKRMTIMMIFQHFSMRYHVTSEQDTVRWIKWKLYKVMLITESIKGRIHLK